MYLLPDAEAWLIDYLRPLLVDVTVSNAVPNPRMPKMVVVRRDGGPGDLVLDRPRMSVRVWAESDEDVTDLAATVRAHLFAAPGNGPCRRWVEQSGPTPIPDESGQPLRYIVGQAVLRGASA